MKKQLSVTLFVIISLALMSILASASPTTIRDSNSERTCEGNKCRVALSDNALDASGNYQHFTDVYKVKWENGAINVSWWQGSFAIRPSVIYNGNEYSISQIKAAYPSINMQSFIIKNGNYKYGFDFSGIPTSIMNDVDAIKFQLVDAKGLSWNDVVKSNGKLYIKDKLVLDFADLKENGYTLNLVNKTTLLISNVSGKTSFSLDPIIAGQYGTDVIHDNAMYGNPTYQGGNMGAYTELLDGYDATGGIHSTLYFNWSAIGLYANNISTIDAMNISLYMVSGVGFATYSIAFHQLFTCFVPEGTGTAWNAGDPNWGYNGSDHARNWLGGIAGTDYNATASANLTYVDADWMNFTVPGSVATSMMKNQIPDCGWILTSNVPSSGTHTAHIASSDAVDTSTRPKVFITYSLLSDTSFPTWKNILNNASIITQKGDSVNWTANISDETALYHAWLEHNGTNRDNGVPKLFNESAIVVSGLNYNVSQNIVINVSKGNYTCGRFWFNDLLSHINVTNWSCFTVVELIKPTWNSISNNASNTTYSGGNVSFGVNLQDDNGLSYAFLEMNGSGTWINYTSVSLSGTSQTINISNTLAWGSGGDYVCGRFWFNDTSNNVNQTSDSCFFIASLGEPIIGIVSPVTINNTWTSRGKIDGRDGNPLINVTMTSIYGINESSIQVYWNRNGVGWNEAFFYGATKMSINNGFAVYFYIPSGFPNICPTGTSFQTMVNVSDNSSDFVSSIYTFMCDYTPPFFNGIQNNVSNIVLSGSNVSFGINFEDLGSGLNFSWFETNDSGTWKSVTNKNMNNNLTGVFNTSIIVEGYNGDYVCGRFRVNDSVTQGAVNANISSESCFTVYSQLNISAIKTLDNAVIMNFSINISGSSGFFESENTITGTTWFNLSAGTYTAVIYAEGFGVESASITVSVSPYNYTFSLLPVHSFLMGFWNEETNSQLNGTNVSVSLINPSYAINYSTENGSLYFPAGYEGEWEIRYVAPGFRLRSYYINIVNISAYNLRLYLLNETPSSLLMISVEDFNSEKLEGAIVKIQRYYIDCNCYRTVQMAKTDFNGKAGIYAVLNTVWYKFITEVNFKTLQISIPTQLFSTTYTIQVNTFKDSLSYLSSVKGFYYLLYYNNASKNWIYTWDDISGISVNGCLKVYQRSNWEDTVKCHVCDSTTSGTLLCFVNETSGSYIAEAYIDIPEGSPYLLGVERWDFSVSNTFGNLGVFISFIIICVVAFVGWFNPTVAIIFGVLGLLITTLTGLLSFGAAGGTVVICIALIGLLFITKMRT